METKIKPVQSPCYQTKKITLKPEQIKEREKKLDQEYWAIKTPGIAQVTDWDGAKRREYEEKKKHLGEDQEKIPCEASKSIENKKTEPILVVQNKPKESKKIKKETEKAKFVNKNKKLAKKQKKISKKELKAIEVVSNPPVALSQPSVFIQANNTVNTPEEKLNKFKSYYYFYKEEFIKNPEVKQQVKKKWQELAVEMAGHRGTQVYEDFIRFSGEEVAPNFK